MSFTKILVGCFLLFSQNVFAQNSIKILTEKKGVSLRGLSVPSSSVIWASGSKGSIAKSVDGGAHFEWTQVKGYEKRDFRSIHAWNGQEAVIVAVAAPAVILKTIDGGNSWTEVYQNADTAMFLDAIHFKDTNHGMIVGDPIDGHLFLLHTKDKGNHWSVIKSSYFKSPLKDGEAFFASSSTNLTQKGKDAYFVTGGKASRLWCNGNPIELPIVQGGNSTGANSIDIAPSGRQLMIVGGDFTKDTARDNNCVGLQWNAKNATWELDKATGKPNGYRSCVQYFTNNLLIACGTSGVDISKDAGKSWELISNNSFHVVHKQPDTNNGILAGAGGRIALLKME